MTTTTGVSDLLHQKLIGLEELAKRIAELRATGKIVVHCHGCFDLLHIGHIRHLEAALREGDALVVTLSPDRFVQKGPNRPAFSEILRAEAIAALSCVSYVAVNRWPTAVETILLLKPDIFCKGVVRGEAKRDFSDAIQLEQQAIERTGGRIHLTDEVTFSSTTLLNQNLPPVSPEMSAFSTRFRARYTLDDVLDPFERIKQLRILTIGESIIDEYVFCEVMGKANKDPILAARHLYTERYAGGVLAIANHVAGFVGGVRLLSMVGEQESHEGFIKDHVNGLVQSRLLKRHHAPTIVKRRFLQEYMAVKLFEVYEMRNEHLTADEEEALCTELEAILPEVDVVIVADYGHGLMTERAIEILCRQARFLAVNAQTNAGNRGFNFITRYPRADYISIDEPEARLEARNRKADETDLIRMISERMDCPRIMLTVGKRGCITWERNCGFHEVPALTSSTLDRLGAGDAVLAITAPCVALGLPMDLVAFLGNVAGAEACNIMGNKSAISPERFFRHIRSFLK